MRASSSRLPNFVCTQVNDWTGKESFSHIILTDDSIFIFVVSNHPKQDKSLSKLQAARTQIIKFH